MPWTDAQLAAAFNALSPVPATLADGVKVLEAQTTQIAVDVPVQSVAGYLGNAMKLAGFLAWAASPPTGASTASIAAAQELAFAFQHPQLFPTFYMSNPTTATQMQGALAALVSPGSGVAGPITAADQAAIIGLAAQTVPVWQPALQIVDLQRVQRAGAISAMIPPYPGYVAP